MQFLHGIHSITSHIFHNKYKPQQCIYLFSLVLKTSDTNISNINASTNGNIKQTNIKNRTYYFLMT